MFLEASIKDEERLEDRSLEGECGKSRVEEGKNNEEGVSQISKKPTLAVALGEK